MGSLRKGAFYLLAGSAGQSVLRVLFTAVLARLLTPADFGLLATATIITGFAELFVQFGFGQGLVQKKEIDQADVGTAYTSSLILGLGFGLLLVGTAPFIATFFEQPQLTTILRYLSILFPLKSLNQVQFSILQKDMKFKSLAGRDVLSYGVGYGAVGISLAFLDFGVMALVYAILVQALVYSLLLGVSQRAYKMRFTFSRDSYKELFSFGKNLTLAKIYNYLALKGDYFVVSKFIGIQGLGFYSRAYGLMNSPNSILGQVVNTVLFADFSKNQDDMILAARRVKQSLDVIVKFCLPTLPWLYFFAEEIVLVLLGDQWLPVIAPFRILMVGMIFRLLYKVGGSYLRGGGLIRYQRRVQFIYMLLVLIGSFIGSFFGIEQVAWAVNIALVVNFILMTNKTFGAVGLSWKDFFVVVWRVLPITMMLFGTAMGLKYFITALELLPLVTLAVSFCLMLIEVMLLEFMWPRLFGQIGLVYQIKNLLKNRR